MPYKSTPVKNGTAEGTSGARSAQEQVPYSVGERFSLAGIGKPYGAGRSAQANRHDLSLRLTQFDVGSKCRAVREIGTGECRVVRWIASLISN